MLIKSKLTTLKKEQQAVYKVLRQCIGMQRIDILDLLLKIEMLLSYTSGTLTRNEIKHLIDIDKDVKEDLDIHSFTVLPNGKFCQCIGANDWLCIYKEQKKGIYKWKIFDTYYFKIEHPFSKITKLTKKNLLENFQGTSEEVDIRDFLTKNRSIKKKKFIRKLLKVNLHNTNNY
ncbi:hypothetical protein GCM10022259_07030 [Aquimarina mytili]